MNSEEILAQYRTAQYDLMKTVNREEENQCFDHTGQLVSMDISFENKVRDFTSSKRKYLDENDILVEAVQNVPYMLEGYGKNLSNQTINRIYTARPLNVAIGWFYKIETDRLLYLRNLDGSPYDLIDIDWKYFKPWVLDMLNNKDNSAFKLHYSLLTTGTINYCIPMKEIPSNYYHYKNYTTQ